ncbi:MAG: hypothetical protein J2P31_00025 [Blastocatellia bacterium]|nr:hypothetical protein [Blastocatellia bacterium]
MARNLRVARSRLFTSKAFRAESRRADTVPLMVMNTMNALSCWLARSHHADSLRNYPNTC